MKVRDRRGLPRGHVRTSDIKIDSSFVARRSELPLIKGYCGEAPPPRWYEPQLGRHQHALAYYECNASEDPSRRIRETVELSPCRPHFGPPVRDAYSEESARLRYLESRPACYVVLGKPGLETEQLAEAIAAARNCVLLSASRVRRELEAAADADCGCDGTVEAAWEALMRRASARDVAHRGYVLEGLPLIRRKPSSPEASASPSNLTDPCGAEKQPTGDYVVVTLQDAAPSPVNSDSATNLQQQEAEQKKESVESSEKSSSVRSESVDTAKSLCSMISTKYFDGFTCPSPSEASEKTLTGDLECSCSTGESVCSKCLISEQLEHVFVYWKLKPDVIVQLTCPDDEIMAKYKKCFCDSVSSVENVGRDSDSSDAAFDRSFERLFDDVDSLANAKSFSENLEYQLEIFAGHVAEFIERIVISHNPQNVICIDGRYPVEHNIETVKIRMQILPLQVAIVPEKLRLPSDLSDSSEGESKYSMDEGGEYENDYFEEADENVDLNAVFESVKGYEIISDMFEWKLSRWKFLCPVELAKGRKIEGKKKHIVRFMNFVFFLSSSEAMETFVENPRPYLLPPNPRPTCRIAVIGPRYSGKTKLSFDLASEFRSTVINVGNMMDRLSLNFQRIDIKNKIKTLSSNESVRSDNPEVLNEIVRCIENLPEQDCGDFLRNSGFILDDVNLDFDFCKKLLENDIAIEKVVILFESDPFTELVGRWNERDSRISCESRGEMIDNTFEDNESFDKSCFSVSDFVRDLRYFNSNCRYVASKLVDIGLEVILCDIGAIGDLSDHVISKIRQEYYYTMTPIEGLDDHFEENEFQSIEDVESQVSSTHAEEEDYQLGDFNRYCPIAMLEHNTIWKGKEKYGCLLGHKMYYMSSETAFDVFKAKYTKLPLPLERPFKLPRLKIFIVGPPGSGKSVLSEYVSGELGLTNIDFYKRFEGYMHDRGIDVKRIKLHVNKENFEDESSSSSDETEFNFPEDLNSLYYKYDPSTITNLYFKYRRESTKLPRVLINECVFDFFAAPFNAYGVVVNTFPNYISDCEMMLNNFLIPDIIIELKVNFRTALERALKDLMHEWQLEQDDLKLEDETRYSKELYCYYEKREKWMKHEKLKKYREKKMEFEGESSDEITLYSSCTSLSDIDDYMDVVTEEDERELSERYKREHPKPKRFAEWESEEAASERFAIQIEQDYENSLHNISLLENYFKSHSVPWVKLDTDASEDLVCKRLLYTLIPYYRRNASFFEKTFEIENVTAENLLASGYCFLSSFGRYCPVQAYDHKIPFQIFLPSACQGRTFAVLHRQYIYFLVGREAVEAFKNDPLKYIDQDSHVPLIPAVISVIGPPLSGKTTLSKRFASTYGFETISREEVINYVLCNFPLINLSAAIRRGLQNGEPVSTEQFIAVVKLFLSNSQCVTQGCVFDGFPASIEEAAAFNARAISPLIIVDLQVPMERTLRDLENDDSMIFSNPYVYRRCEDWNADAERYRGWLSDCFGNLVGVDATRIAASVWRSADEQVRHRFKKFLQYVREAGYDKPHNLEYLRVTPQELQRRVGRFRLFCPGCVRHGEDFNALDVARGRRGLYQFRDCFYWFCAEHVSAFKKCPRKFMRDLEEVELPGCYPEVVHDTLDVKNYCWAQRLVNKGFCLVTYIDSLPRRNLVPGDPSLGVLLADKLYLFCSKECRGRFCRRFCKYANWKIFFPSTLQPLEVQKLPLLGFLEQSVAKAIANAANYVSTLRPKLPGLPSSKSAAVFLGVYLKTQLANGEAPYFSRVLARMEGRCEFFDGVLAEMKGRLNPWLFFEDAEEEDEKQCTVQKIGHVESIGCFHDPLQVKFTRTSPTPWVESLQSVVTRR